MGRGCCVSHQFSTALILRVDGHPEGVSSEREFGHVDPLTVDVVVVDVLAAGRDALLPIVLAVVLGIHPGAEVVLEAKASKERGQLTEVRCTR